jgi:hypothetical protein
MNLNFEVKRISHSVTQGSAAVYCNGEYIVTFGDDRKLIDGEWKSPKPDTDFIIGALFHPFPEIERHGEKIRKIISGWGIK